MDPPTRAQLLELNRAFYLAHATAFDRSRAGRPWPGWQRILGGFAAGRPLGRVLDVGCGNARFACFLAEAGLSFLGLGIQLPTASWGNLLADAPQYYTSRPLLMVWPGVALLLTTLAFNLLGDGLRDAFDPRGSR